MLPSYQADLIYRPEHRLVLGAWMQMSVLSSLASCDPPPPLHRSPLLLLDLPVKLTLASLLPPHPPTNNPRHTCDMLTKPPPPSQRWTPRILLFSAPLEASKQHVVFMGPPGPPPPPRTPPRMFPASPGSSV